MEKLTIPVQTTLDYDLQDTPKAIKGMSVSKSGALIGMNLSDMNMSREQSTNNQSHTQLLTRQSPNEENQKKSKFGSFPKITKGSETALEYSNSARDPKLSSKHRKFEFVVPQHRLSKPDEKIADYTIGSDLLNLNDTSQSGSLHKGSGYEQNNDVRAPYPFDLDDIPVKEGEDGYKTPDDERQSVLGTREIAQTFNKVFDQMKSGGIKLPAINR